MLDIWNIETFNQEIIHILKNSQALIVDFWAEEQRTMDAYIDCGHAEPIQSNNLTTAYNSTVENILTPAVAGTAIRLWHYTRLLDHEAASMSNSIHLSTLETLRARLQDLKSRQILTHIEADILFNQSPFQTQNDARSNKLYATVCPYPSTYQGVTPFLKRWGGESTYFHLQDVELKEKLKTIGHPRIVEIKLDIESNLNAYRVADSVARAWARKGGQQTEPINFDYITKAPEVVKKVIRIHTEGDELFSKVGLNYPNSCHLLCDE